MKLGELAELLECSVVGNPEVEIKGVAEILCAKATS